MNGIKVLAFIGLVAVLTLSACSKKKGDDPASATGATNDFTFRGIRYPATFYNADSNASTWNLNAQTGSLATGKVLTLIFAGHRPAQEGNYTVVDYPKDSSQMGLMAMDYNTGHTYSYSSLYASSPASISFAGGKLVISFTRIILQDNTSAATDTTQVRASLAF